MPRISLKPRSAEFASGPEEQPRQCDMPGCRSGGAYKAPKGRDLRDYYHFCLEHIQEYNSAWDFFSGMSSREIEEHMRRSIYGDRPTWRYDAFAAAEKLLRRKAWTMRDEEEQPQSHREAQNRNSPEFEALAMMGLEPPVTLKQIKARYKELAKRHHPDLNSGCAESGELLKRINMAYTILKLAYKRFEELPPSR